MNSNQTSKIERKSAARAGSAMIMETDSLAECPVSMVVSPGHANYYDQVVWEAGQASGRGEVPRTRAPQQVCSSHTGGACLLSIFSKDKQEHNR
jgi:hypothetical protein